MLICIALSGPTSHFFQEEHQTFKMANFRRSFLLLVLLLALLARSTTGQEAEEIVGTAETQDDLQDAILSEILDDVKAKGAAPEEHAGEAEGLTHGEEAGSLEGESHEEVVAETEAVTEKVTAAAEPVVEKAVPETKEAVVSLRTSIDHKKFPTPHDKTCSLSKVKPLQPSPEI